MITVNWTAPASTGTLYATLLMKPNSGTLDTLRATTAITIYTPPTYTVSVTPDGSDVTVSQPIDTTYQFRVSDIGNTNAMYALSVSCPGLTCSVPSTVAVTHGSYLMVTVSFNSGSPGITGTVTLSASATGTSDNGSVNVVPLTHSVSVTPAGSAINVRAASDTTAPFTVTLDGTASSVTYHLVVSCTEPVYDCTGDSTVAVTKGTPQAVTVSYKTRTDLHGGTGSLTLKATSVYGATYESTGSYSVTVPNTTDLYTVSAASKTTTIARDKCVAVSAGIGAAYECGDLRLVHALPSVRTMAKEWTPVLLYSSQTAHVAPYVGANVFLQSFATTPTALTGTLTLNGGTPCSQSWTTSGWTVGTTRRIVATCGDVSLATGVYPYTLVLTATFTGGGTMNESLTGSLIVVNRSASPFGAGWWLAGLEQINFPSDGTTRLWVGGDGSARVYRQRGSSNAFYADSVDRPDSLTYDSGTSTYTRWAPHGLKVLFNSSGQHTSTVNRLGQTTSFAYSSGLLQTITVPPSSAGLTYTFTYTGSKLTGVSAPGTPSGSRSVAVTQSSGRISVITDPDASTVSFGYSGSDTRVTSRTDRLGHATAYGYGTTGTLDSVSVAMASPTPAIVTSFDAGEIKGMTGGSVVDTELVYTTINGPRRDTTVTKVWVDGYGAPTKIVDALNDTTRITRGDSRWPVLVTRVVDASGFVTSATYDARGNIATDTAVSPLGGSGGNAVNTYTYDGAYDFATRIVGPTGEVWRASIDGSTGNRTSEALARSVADGGTALQGHTAFEEYRYDALGRRIWTRARRWCDDTHGAGGGADAVACQVSSVRRTVWEGDQELAEIQMPATDSTSVSTIENDTLAIVRPVPGTGDALYDANRLYGQVLYVNGPETDRPLAITRNHYADASKTSGSGSATYAVYAPFSIVPLWNSQSRADESVIGGTAAPGADYLCVDTGKTRCAEVSLDWGVFPYARSGAATGPWQGTLLLDKPDAAGTYYRRNRSYDPATARFTQEDPIGLAGGINEYGFANGDPANYGDPFGLCPIKKDGIPCTADYGLGVKVSSGIMHLALDAIAAEADRPLLVYGGDRSPARNASVGGAPKSSHLKGKAADVIFEGTTKKQTLELLYGSQARREFDVRLLYHQNGSSLPEHSHLDLQPGPDITEQPIGKHPKYVPLKEPFNFP